MIGMKNTFLAAVLYVFAAAMPASAATIVSATGSGGGLSLGSSFSADGAVQTFNVTQDIYNARIGIDLALCTGICEGRVQLYETAPDLGGIVGALSTLVSDMRFCGTSRLGCDSLTGSLPRTVFSDLILNAGSTYSIAVGIVSGGAVWFGSADDSSRVVTGEGGASVGEAYSIPTLFSSTVLLSNPVSSIAPGGLNFLIDGDYEVSIVPLPAGIVFLGTALMVLGFRRRRT